MNTYSKFTANVFIAKCEEQQEKGDVITVTTKYGKENECIVFNLMFEKDGFYFYSIIREDGFDFQEYANRKFEKFSKWASSSENKSSAFYEKSKKDNDFLSLGEPIKVGHHSEKWHRKVIEQANQNMFNSIEHSKKAEIHESKAQYWEKKAKDINLSMTESVEFYEYRLEQANEQHEGLKSGKYERRHSYSLTYAKKAVNEADKNLKLAKSLWE